VLSRFGLKRDEVMGGWRKLHNGELCDLYSSPSIIRMNKSKRIKWEGHVAQMGRRGMHIGYWRETQKERDVRGWTLLKWIFERQNWGGMEWTDLVQDRDNLRVPVNTVY
jgi:hypothetical protein